MDGPEDIVTYEFGEWVVETHLNRIRRGELETQLEPRTSEVLRYLLEHPGEIVSLDQLLDNVWRGRIVEPNNIHRNVNRIRRALGDDPRQPIYIETISKRGYRTVAPVTRLAQSQPTDSGLVAELQRSTPPFPAYEGDDPFVFVCYAHEDRVEVYRELHRLREAGFNIWYDEGISIGADWTDEIATAIADCAHFLFFASPRALQSHNCLDEVQLARNENKPLIAVHLAPTTLSRSLQLTIGRFQALHKYALPEREYARKLIASLSAPTTPLQSQESANPHRRNALWALGAVVLVSLLTWFGVNEFHAPDSTDIGLENSVAVAAFKDMTPTHDQQWIGGVIVSKLRVNLGALGLQVVGSTPYGARELTPTVGNARYVVEGRVIKIGDQLQVLVELRSTESGYQLWAEDYDRAIATDDLSAQTEIATLIAQAVAREIHRSGKPTLVPAEAGDSNTGSLQGILRDTPGAVFPGFGDADPGGSDE